MKMELKQISLQEAKKYKLLGRAFGVNLEHCIKEGKLHCKDFEKRAKYYVVISHIKSDNSGDRFISNSNEVMVAEFYE